MLQIVQRGVNGAVTLSGTLASAGGGALIGLIFALVGLVTAKCEGSLAYKQWLALPLGAFAGLFGSVCDSLLGATMQYSGYCVVRKKVRKFQGRNSVVLLDAVLNGLLDVFPTGGREAWTYSKKNNRTRHSRQQWS